MNCDASLMSMIEDRIASGNVQLPPANRVSTRLQALTASDDFEMKEVVQLISSDQVLTAEVLRVANGPLYGGLSEAKTLEDATVRLGTNEIARLAMVCAAKQGYEARDPRLASMLPRLWEHSVATAMGASWLARKLGYRNLQNEAFIGGLLHDVGALLIVRVIDQIMLECESHPVFGEAVLREVLHRGHTDHGYTLARMWNLPEVYCGIVRDHHEKHAIETNPLLNLVVLADKACYKLGIGLERDDSLRLDATEQAYALNATDLVLAELSIMLEDSAALV